MNGKEDRLGSLKFRLPVALPLAEPVSRRFCSSPCGWNHDSGVAMEIRGEGMRAEEFLSPFSSFKPNLAAFLLSCRSMELLDQVVTAGTRHKLDMLYRVEHW